MAARVGDRELLLSPRSPTTSRLVRGSSVRTDNELGSFERVEGSLVVVEWSTDVTVLGVTAHAPVPEPVEAAVGYAMAAAFGTGARFFIAALLDGIGQATPG